jgi:translation initiation factor IF-2
MKISDIARKLGVSIKEVREKAKELEFSIAQKSNTMNDKKAKEFIEAVQKVSGSQEEVTRKKDEAEEAERQKEEEIESKKTVKIPEVISVKDFAEKLEMPVTKVMTELIKNGVMASIN